MSKNQQSTEWQYGYDSYWDDSEKYCNPYDCLTTSYQEFRDGYNYAHFEDKVDKGYYDWLEVID